MRPDNRFVLCVTFYERDPAGTLIAQRGNSRAKTEAVANPFQYTAGYLDSNTGLYKLGARYYDPTLGRFTQQDPSGQEVNLYAYAGNNPINNVDPSGRSVECGYITCTAYFTLVRQPVRHERGE